MKKRIGIAVIAIALLLSGCTVPLPMEILEQVSRIGDRAGDSAEKSVSQSEENKETTKVKRDNGNIAETGTDGQEDDASPEGQVLSVRGSSDDEEGEAADSYVKGTTTDDGWESEYWNLRFTAPEGIFMLSEEGLDALMGISEDIVQENYSEKQQEYLEMTTLYEMVATSAEGDPNVAVSVEKLMVRGMTTEDYKKVALLHLRMLQNPVYEILEDNGTAEIAGETFAMVNTTAKGEDDYLQDYYFRVEDDRALIITITYREATADQAPALLGGFDVY